MRICLMMKRVRVNDVADLPAHADDEPAGVLVVDDEPAVARTIERILTRAGFSVVTANGGRDALAKLRHFSFDAVISDLDMPDTDGRALLRSIRAMDLDVPFLLLTGRPDLDSAIDAVEFGAFRYLVKPVPPDDLVRVVARAAHWHRFAVLRRAADSELNGHQLGERAGLEVRFASAMERLWIATQPIVSWKERGVLGYECLVRTDEPSLSNPVALMDAAERLGSVHELGRKIRAEVAARIPSAPAGTQIFVNLHPSDLEDEELSSPGAPLTEHASRVVLEVTERATLDRISSLPQRMARLRKLGFQIAVDDLGAGYAGLSSFALIEPDVVKADMSLVRGIHTSPVKQKLVSAIAALADDLGIRLIAEGIETPAERECVTGLGSVALQGYLFSRPAPGFPIPKLLTTDGSRTN
jgi:EAL domain-containing protein (putative c-di-GMP-specific phosphodiesterase class I)/CheY-like chemotaxis protein